MSNEYRFRRKRVRHAADEPAVRKPDFQEEQGEAEADAVSDEMVRAAGPDSERQMDAIGSADAPTRARVIQRLQAEHGNQYVQRLMVQRQAAAGSAASLFDTGNMRGAAADVLDKQQAPVRQWLDANTASLNALSVAELILLIRRNATAKCVFINSSLVGDQLASNRRKQCSRTGLAGPRQSVRRRRVAMLFVRHSPRP